MSELRERLAELVGWNATIEQPITLFGIEVGREVLQRNDGPWMPDEDLNQARLCLLKLGELGLQRKFTNLLIDRHMKELTSGSVYNGHGALWSAATMEAAEICQSILTVIDNQKEGQS